MDKKRVIRRLNDYKLTEFQMRVLLAAFSIPKGDTRSYKQVAEMAGYPGAARAVGSVMKMNPLAPDIPCHRVIKSDGRLGNYSAPGGPRKKASMLRKEHAI